MTIKPLMNTICLACKAFYHPRINPVVNDRLVACRAKREMTLYMKAKLTKFKFFVLSDSSNGYNVDFSVYTGKNSFPTDRGLSHGAVMSLLDRKVLGSGYHVYMDDFYTSPKSQTCLLWCLVLVEHTETRGRTSQRLQLSHWAEAPAWDPSGGFGTGLLCVWSGWTRKWCLFVPPSMLPIWERTCKWKSKQNIHGRQSLFRVLHPWLHTTSTWGVLTCPISCCNTTPHNTKQWSGTEKSFYTSWTLPPTKLSYCTKSCLATWLPISSWKSLLPSSVAYHRKQHQNSLAQTMCQFQEISWLQTSEELLLLVAGSVCIAKQVHGKKQQTPWKCLACDVHLCLQLNINFSRNGTKVCDC